MSTIGNLSGPSLIPQPLQPAPLAASVEVAETQAATTAAPTIEERLAAALIELGGPASSVGLTGLSRPQAPGDVAVLLAQASLSLEATSDEAAALRGRLALGAIAQALRAFDPQALDELRVIEFASKAEAEALRAEIEAARKPVADRIAQLEALTDKDEIKAAEPELNSLKAQLVEIARNGLDKTAALLQKEVDRLPVGDRRDAAAAQLQATNDSKAGLSGNAAYANAVSALSVNDSLLGGKVQSYDAAGVSAAAALSQSLLAISAAVATVVSSLSAANSNDDVRQQSRSNDFEALLTEIFKASARADLAFVTDLGIDTSDERLEATTARNESEERASLAGFVAALMAALADLAAALAGLDPLTIQQPAVEPGRSRVRLDV